jgi:hypothetical protein
MSQFLSIEIGTNFLAIASGSKTGDSAYSVENVYYEHLPFQMDSLKLSLASQLSEMIQTATSTWQLGNDIIVSFNGQSSFIKSVPIENNAPKQILMENIQWEFEQVSASSREEFSFAIHEDLINKRNVIIAIRNQRVEFAKELAISLNKSLIGINLTSANTLNLVDTVATNAILLSLNDSFVEIALIYNGHFQNLNIFSYPNGIDFNDLNINLRKSNDLMMSDGFTPESIFATGAFIKKSDAEQISNAVQIPIELIDPFKSVTFNGVLTDISSGAYCSTIGALIQV